MVGLGQNCKTWELLRPAVKEGGVLTQHALQLQHVLTPCFCCCTPATTTTQEGERVMATFTEHLHLPVTKVDHSAVMLAKLKGVTDPEAKRKIIGAEFIEVGVWGEEGEGVGVKGEGVEGKLEGVGACLGHLKIAPGGVLVGTIATPC